MKLFNLPFDYHRLYYNKPLRILLLANSLIFIAGAMLGPIYALFVESVGGTLLAASSAGAIFALAAGFTTLVSGSLSDRFKKSELIVIAGFLIIGLGFLLYMAVSSIWSLLAVQVLIGFGDAVYQPAFDEIYSKHLDRYQEGREWGAWEAARYFTTAFGSLLGGFIAVSFGFNALFILMALLCFTSAFYIYMLPKNILHG